VKLKDGYTNESQRINKQISAMKQMLNQTEEVYSKRQKETEACFHNCVGINLCLFHFIGEFELPRISTLTSDD
jgi:hypothetical protein